MARRLLLALIYVLVRCPGAVLSRYWAERCTYSTASKGACGGPKSPGLKRSNCTQGQVAPRVLSSVQDRVAGGKTYNETDLVEDAVFKTSRRKQDLAAHQQLKQRPPSLRGTGDGARGSAKAWKAYETVLTEPAALL